MQSKENSRIEKFNVNISSELSKTFAYSIYYLTNKGTSSGAAAARSKTEKRALLIKCCGRASCSKLPPKKKPSNIKISNKTSSFSRPSKRTPVGPAANRSLGETGAKGNIEQSARGEQSSGPVEDQISSVGPAEESTLRSADGNANTDSCSSADSDDDQTDSTSAVNSVPVSAELTFTESQPLNSNSQEKSLAIPSSSAIVLTGGFNSVNSAGVEFSTEKMTASQTLAENSVLNSKSIVNLSFAATESAAVTDETTAPTALNSLESTKFSTEIKTTAIAGPKTANETSVVSASTATSTSTKTTTTTSTSLKTTTSPTGSTGTTKGYTTVTTRAPQVNYKETRKYFAN